MNCPVCGYLVGGHKLKIKRDRLGNHIEYRYRCSGQSVVLKKKEAEA